VCLVEVFVLRINSILKSILIFRSFFRVNRLFDVFIGLFFHGRFFI
jgi:hypothetical protein